METKDAAALFRGWADKPMVRAALEGAMGRIVAGGEPARSARLEIGDFAFFAGEADRALAQGGTASILVPGGPAWEALLEEVRGDAFAPWTRYAMPPPPAFDRGRLGRYTAALPPGYALRPMDGALYRQAMGADWSRDLCALFAGEGDYLARGIGMAVVREGRLAAGASSYAVCRGGIEIEIDTRPDCRRRGLALACGAALILACLARGLEPGWDAHDPRSAALAQKLGYRPGKAYPVRIKTGAFPVKKPEISIDERHV